MARPAPDALILRGVGVTADDGWSLGRALQVDVQVETKPDRLDVHVGTHWVPIEEVVTVVLSAGAGATAKHMVDGVLDWARQRAAANGEPVKVRIYDGDGSVLKEVRVDSARRRRLRLPWRWRRRPQEAPP